MSHLIDIIDVPRIVLPIGATDHRVDAKIPRLEKGLSGKKNSAARTQRRMQKTLAKRRLKKLGYTKRLIDMVEITMFDPATTQSNP